MSSLRLNLKTRHGTKAPLYTFTEWHFVTLAEDVPVSTNIAPTTLLRVVVVTKEIPDATVLEFMSERGGCGVIRFTTKGVTPVWATSISIQPYVGSKVPCKMHAYIVPKDLTGRVYKAGVKKKFSDPVPFLLLNCLLQPLAGNVSIVADTTTLPATDANCNFLDLPEDHAELQIIQNLLDEETGKLLYSKAIAASYFWDLEYTTASGDGPIPDYEGRFWITAEATV
jgi:hypothetical protein